MTLFVISLTFLNASKLLDNSTSLYDSPALSRASFVLLQYGQPTVVITAISVVEALLMLVDAFIVSTRPKPAVLETNLLMTVAPHSL